MQTLISSWLHFWDDKIASTLKKWYNFWDQPRVSFIIKRFQIWIDLDKNKMPKFLIMQSLFNFIVNSQFYCQYAWW